MITINITNITTSSIILLLLATIIYLLRNPEVVDKWSNILYRLSFWMGEKKEKRIISSNLDYRITHIAKNINKEFDGIMPYGARIIWKDPEDVSAFVQKNNVVIVLKKNDSIDKNIVDACMAYVPLALIPKAKNIINGAVKKAVDLHIIKKMLLTGQYSTSYNYFNKNVIEPELKKNENCKTLLEAVNKMDEVGIFTRVLLSEFKKLGDLIYGTIEENEYKKESGEFFKFLNDFVNRQPGSQDTKLAFIGNKIKISILLVAKRSTIEDWGIDAYLSRISKEMDDGVDRIFVFSYSKLEEKLIKDAQGYVKDVKYEAGFKPLDQLEEKCKNINYLKLIKKQNYKTKDVTGKLRSAKYLLYQVIR